MKELACQFGSGSQRLVGVMTEPEHVDVTRPAFVFINAGLLNKIGPHRLYVLMARRLAELGFVSLRFDLSGIGDSADGSLAGKTLEERKFFDIKTALDYLSETKSLQQFVLSGLCSGAEDSFRAGVIDQRVRGMYLIDVNAYETARSKLRFNMYRPLRKALKAVGWYTKRTYMADNTGSEGIDFLASLPLAESEKSLQKLLDRQVEIKYVFTGGAYHHYNYKDQIYDIYENIERTDLIEVEMYPAMGHLPLLIDDKNKLVHSLAAWAKKRF